MKEAGVVNFGNNVDNFNFIDDAGLDSFEIINIISDIESILGAELPMHELEKTGSHTISGFVKVAEGVIRRIDGGNLR
ncbi:acyl carrier protein [Polynucleobacter necessarius]|uniref:acyl carrier protein n=1 Tax=Polynucleobacter necessarius TaxID=576610 RepID=UPI0013B05390|nr:acyl carrier protein [Polynucleobacter necessarius]